MTQRERWIERLVAAAFALTMLSGLALLAVYGLGGQTQVEGVLLAICLGALGFGIVVWAQELMETPIAVEERHALASQTGPAVSKIMDEEAGFTRRTLLVRMLLGALGGLAAALAIPALSLGPAPGRELFVTSWAPGRRLVDIDGIPVRAADLEIGSAATVFPEGDAGSAQAQTLLIRVEPDALRLSPDRLANAPNGYVAYSKVCTHAGCPVGLYRAPDHMLICPCHQSTFDVLQGAIPVFGPAGRALPQLPIAMAEDGTFTALGDFPEPVGPAFWNLTS
ncbi:MAG TPA: Rieske 2Fe-2S domain-containing protein [Candidatus Limnocylindrales bacterium]|nr:Rieske 2Fe-2S domain-containing protein [Candidatus Limnocylindrales bacterium]